jgi:hypothetical protein
METNSFDGSKGKQFSTKILVSNFREAEHFTGNGKKPKKFMVLRIQSLR